MNLCDDCKFGKRLYADGHVYTNWSGSYDGDVTQLPETPDPKVFWTYVECAKNSKKLQFLNLDGKCTSFKRIDK